MHKILNKYFYAIVCLFFHIYLFVSLLALWNRLNKDQRNNHSIKSGLRYRQEWQSGFLINKTVTRHYKHQQFYNWQCTWEMQCPIFDLAFFRHGQVHEFLWTTKFQSGQVNAKSYLPSLATKVCGAVCNTGNTDIEV